MYLSKQFEKVISALTFVDVANDNKNNSIIINKMYCTTLNATLYFLKNNKNSPTINKINNAMYENDPNKNVNGSPRILPICPDVKHKIL